MGKVIRWLCRFCAIILFLKGLFSLVYQDVSEIFPAMGDREETKFVTIHHTKTMNHCTVGEVDSYHRNNNGWGSGFAYHFYICDHKVFKVHDMNSATGHALHHNYDAIAICVSGDFDKEEPDFITIAELWILTKVITVIYQDCKITAHCDLNITGCCGKNLIEHVRKWQEN